MGRVYRAVDRRTGAVVAVKVIARARTGDAAAETRFRREAALVAELSHPNIIRTMRIGQDTGTPYIVSEFIDGLSLAELLGRRRVTLGEAVAIVGDVAAALGTAHAAGVVHRDVKPENIMVARDGRVILGDFGVARQLDDSAGATLTGGLVGTPAYAAPEQLMGATVGPRCDQYSLACVAHELLTGSRVFDGTAQQVVDAHLRAAPPDAAEANPAVPRAVAEVVITALQKDPADRYASVGDFAEMFGRQAAVRAQAPIVSLPGGPVRRARRIGAAILAAVGVVGLVAGTWWSRPDGVAGAGDPLSFMVRSDAWRPFGDGLVVREELPDGLTISGPARDYLPLRGVVHSRTGSCDFTFSTRMRILPPAGVQDGLGVGIGIGTRLVRGVPHGWSMQFEVHPDRALWLREVVLPVQARRDQPAARRVVADGLARHAVALRVRGAAVDITVDGTPAGRATLPAGTGCGVVMMRVWGGGAEFTGVTETV